jgi:hypothetical protein
MSKQIDFEKPLSDEDRAWLKDHSQSYLIEENDRKFGKEPPAPKVDDSGGQELETTGAAENWEPGTEPKVEFAYRPYDPPISGHYAVEPAVEPQSVEEVDVDELTVEELKEELQARGESTSGSRNDLVKRLEKATKGK